MNEPDEVWPLKCPHLSAGGHFSPEQSWTFKLADRTPPDHQVSNAYLIPYVNDQWMLLHAEADIVVLPGGTLEPGETVADALHRELREEAGALVKNVIFFGIFHCRSSAERPYRPHLPHPYSCRAVGYGPVEIVDRPSNPPDGERIARVELATLDEVVRFYRAHGRGELAELYQMAAALRADL